ncbi:DUF1294 domain-containing protein [Paenibacillus vulneris]|uniref:DUF1294 domain-containing protein n=1 Tax=Paenibacillus vulneris TaxID=1133364 RepID=A0ABW3UKV5_9BACL|nr:DUF1294 domain-containing protein [Paenibacillus sp. 32352]
MYIIIIYLIILNAAGFFMMGYDKVQSRRGGRRIPEKRLMTLAAAGGALGTWAAMRLHRHKTKHMKFVAGVPLLFLLNVVCVYYVYKLIS